MCIRDSSHDDVYPIGHEVGADLVQVGLVGLCVGVIVGVVEGDALLLGHHLTLATKYSQKEKEVLIFLTSLQVDIS